MRKSKDDQIRRLSSQMAMQKASLQKVIDGHEETMKGLTDNHITLESKVLAMEIELQNYPDVLKQNELYQKQLREISE